MLDSEAAEAILEFLARYHFASIEHIALALLWETGQRISGAVAIDWSDIDLEDQYIQLSHRLETETPLKNGQSGERFVALSDDLADLLEERHQRITTPIQTTMAVWRCSRRAMAVCTGVHFGDSYTGSQRRASGISSARSVWGDAEENAVRP